MDIRALLRSMFANIDLIKPFSLDLNQDEETGCPLWVISGQTVPSQNSALSALVQKRTFAIRVSF